MCGVDCAIAKIPEERKLVPVSVDGVSMNRRQFSHSECGRRSQFERRRTICGGGTSVNLDVNPGRSVRQPMADRGDVKVEQRIEKGSSCFQRRILLPMHFAGLGVQQQSGTVRSVRIIPVEQHAVSRRHVSQVIAILNPIGPLRAPLEKNISHAQQISSAVVDLAAIKCMQPVRPVSGCRSQTRVRQPAHAILENRVDCAFITSSHHVKRITILPLLAGP